MPQGVRGQEYDRGLYNAEQLEVSISAINGCLPGQLSSLFADAQDHTLYVQPTAGVL